MDRQDKLIFKTEEPIHVLGNEKYKLKQIAVLTGGSLDEFSLNIISHIGGVRSCVPIIFSSLPDIIFIDNERKVAKISVKLNLTEKSDIELMLIPSINASLYEVVIYYNIF